MYYYFMDSKEKENVMNTIDENSIRKIFLNVVKEK